MEDPSSGPFVQEPPEPISNGQSPTAESIAAATVAADENGMEDGDGGGMEVDDDDGPATEFEHAPASVDALVPVRMSRTLTNGQSVGVQSDKVADLGPETITLAVRDTNVMHTVWNPQHADILAAGGQALCRIWSIARSPVHPTGNVAPISDAQPPLMEPPQPPQPPQPPDPSEPPQPPEPPEPGQAEISAGNRDSDHHQGRDPPPRPDPWRSVDLLDPPDPDAMVTTMAWSPDGEILAIAMQTDITESTSTVKLLSKSGELIDELPSAHDMVLKFAWNPSGTHLLLVTCSGQDSGTVVVWNVQAAWALPPLSLDHVIVDAAWADDGSFGLCGQNIVLEAVIDGDAIVTRHSRTEFGGDLQWTHIQIDALAHTTAVSAEECATLGIIDDSGELHRTKAHDAEITALVLQPVPRASSTPLASSRLLVTSSLDGTIKLWDIRNPFTTLHVLSLGLSSPALAISFTPDGHLLAAAHWHRILVWNAESGGLPMASWKGEASKWPHLANGVDKDSGIGEEEDGSTHSLHWDADGKRLAYGLGGQVRESDRDEFGAIESNANDEDFGTDCRHQCSAMIFMGFWFSIELAPFASGLDLHFRGIGY